MYDNQETFFFRESELDDSFYLTQEISKHVYRSQIATKKASPEKRSFLPKIKSKQSQLVHIDPNNHLARRKREKNKPFINVFRQIIVSNHIQGVIKQATNQISKSHNQYIQSVANSIGYSFQGKQNIKQFATQQKLLTKKLNKTLLQTKSKSLTATKTLQELIQQREKLKTQNEIILSRVNLLTQYQKFCQQIFGNYRKSQEQKTIFNLLLSEDEMIQLLDKTQQRSLGQSEHIKLIHLSIAQIKKDYEIVKKYFEPKINALVKQVDALKMRQNTIDTQTNDYKFERMKMKNISNVRHPYLTIAPKVISFGIQKMKMNVDSRQIKAPLIVLKQLQVQVQEVLQMLREVKNGNEQKIDKLELQFIKNQSHEAHKSKK